MVVTSSPALYAEQKLALLDGKSIGGTSVLLASTVTLGSQPVRGLCAPTRLSSCPWITGFKAVRGRKQREKRVVEEEMAGSQTTLTAPGTGPTRVPNDHPKKTQKNKACWSTVQLLESHARKCFCVCKNVRGAVQFSHHKSDSPSTWCETEVDSCVVDTCVLCLGRLREITGTIT